MFGSGQPTLAGLSMSGGGLTGAETDDMAARHWARLPEEIAWRRSKRARRAETTKARRAADLQPPVMANSAERSLRQAA